jgi:hypothetical protein
VDIFLHVVGEIKVEHIAASINHTSVRVISKFRNVPKFGNRSQIQEHLTLPNSGMFPNLGTHTTVLYLAKN